MLKRSEKQNHKFPIPEGTDQYFDIPFSNILSKSLNHLDAKSITFAKEVHCNKEKRAQTAGTAKRNDKPFAINSKMLMQQ